MTDPASPSSQPTGVASRSGRIKARMRWCMLLTGAAFGVEVGWLAPRGPAWTSVLSSFVISILIFIWYCADADLRRFRRPLFLNVLVACIAVIGVPVYLWRSRGFLDGSVATLRALGFLLLIYGAMVVPATIGLVMRGVI